MYDSLLEVARRRKLKSFRLTTRRTGSFAHNEMHDLVKGARGCREEGQKNMAHIHCRMDRDWDYSMCESSRVAE